MPRYDEYGLPVFESVRSVFDQVEALIADGKVAAAWTLGFGGVAEGIAKMAFGNGIGFRFQQKLSAQKLFAPCYGGFLLELTDDAATDDLMVIGQTTEENTIVTSNYTLQLDDLLQVWERKLEPVFPCQIKGKVTVPPTYFYERKEIKTSSIQVAHPRVLIPVFPGTNCEYDTARVFERAGARPEIFVIRNLSAAAIEESIDLFAVLIKQAQIIMIPGGFSGGDEPDGSGKFITAFFRSPKIKAAVDEFLHQRDGLMLGICNGFQALIKLGLVPYGEIRELKANDPTLTFNTIGRHISHMAYTRVTSVKSPWFANVNAGDVFAVPVSHGEGRFMADVETVKELAKNGQIATQYVDLAGNPSSDIEFNLNGSVCAIEGITSPDGRVLGKMGHSERKGENLYKNVPFAKDQQIFESGVKYFK